MRDFIDIVEASTKVGNKPQAAMLAMLPRRVVPAGTRLYHGTNTKEGFEIPDGPAWFAPTKKIARKWVGWGGDVHPTHGSGSKRVHIYEATRDIDLVNIERFPDSEHEKNDYESFAQAFCGDDGYYTFANAVAEIDNGWWCKDEIMLGNPGEYLRFVESSLQEDVSLDEASLIASFPKGINTDLTADYKQLAKLLPHKKIGLLGNIKVMASDWPVKSHSLVFLIDDKEVIGKFSIVTDDRFENAITIKYAFITPNKRGKGTGLALYSFFINSGVNLVADIEHTRASRALWARLAQIFVVQIIDEDGKVGKPVSKTNAVYHQRTRKSVLVASKHGFYPTASLTEGVTSGKESEGGWINLEGEFLGLDRGRGINHEDISSQFFDTITDEGPTGEALDAGWLRLYPHKGVMALTWHRPLKKLMARRLLAWFDTYAPYYNDFEFQGCSDEHKFKFETFNDMVPARAFIMKMSGRSLELREAAYREGETMWFNPDTGEIYEVSDHGEAVMEDPEHYGIDPATIAQVRAYFDGTGESLPDEGVDGSKHAIHENDVWERLALNNGFVRFATGHRASQCPYIESHTPFGAWQAVSFMAKNGMLADMIDIEISGGERIFNRLTGGILKQFLRGGPRRADHYLEDHRRYT